MNAKRKKKAARKKKGRKAKNQSEVTEVDECEVVVWGYLKSVGDPPFQPFPLSDEICFISDFKKDRLIYDPDDNNVYIENLDCDYIFRNETKIRRQDSELLRGGDELLFIFNGDNFVKALFTETNKVPTPPPDPLKKRIKLEGNKIAEQWSLQEQEDMSCKICLLIMQKPMKLSPCDHYFCEGCLDDWNSRMQNGMNCPYCQQKVNKYKVSVKLQMKIKRYMEGKKYTQIQEEAKDLVPLPIPHFREEKRMEDREPLISLPRREEPKEERKLERRVEVERKIERIEEPNQERKIVQPRFLLKADQYRKKFSQEKHDQLSQLNAKHKKEAEEVRKRQVSPVIIQQRINPFGLQNKLMAKPRYYPRPNKPVQCVPQPEQPKLRRWSRPNWGSKQDQKVEEKKVEIKKEEKVVREEAKKEEELFQKKRVSSGEAGVLFQKQNVSWYQKFMAWMSSFNKKHNRDIVKKP